MPSIRAIYSMSTALNKIMVTDKLPCRLRPAAWGPGCGQQPCMQSAIHSQKKTLHLQGFGESTAGWPIALAAGAPCRLGRSRQCLVVAILVTLIQTQGKDVAGSMMLILCWLYYPETELNLALWWLQFKFKVWLKEKRLTVSMKAWSTRTICLEKFADYPTLASYIKGVTCRLVLKWLADEANLVVSSGADTSAGAIRRARMLSNLVGAIRISEATAELFMSRDVCDTYVRACRCFLLDLQCEAEIAQAIGVSLFKVRPKLHYWAESLYTVSSTRENPAAFDAFDWESFVGKIKRIVTKTHRRSACLRVVERYLLLCCVRWHRGY